METGIEAEVALTRRIREVGSRTTLAMIRLTGEGVAFLCAHGSAMTVKLEAVEAVEAAWWAVAWYEATADYRLLVVAGNRKFPIRGNRKLHTFCVGGGGPAPHAVDDVNSEGAGLRCTDGRRGCC